MSSKIRTNSLTGGLVAYYPFNGNANDESGNGNNGVVKNAILSADRFDNFNSAYSFNGVSSYIIVNDGSQLNFVDSFTVSLWVKPLSKWSKHPISNQQWAASLLDKSHDNSFSQWCIQQDLAKENYQQLTCGIGNTWMRSESTQLISNEWNHFTTTMQGTTLKVYLNGVLKSTTNGGSSSIKSNNNSPLFIGANSYYYQNSISRFFNGVIDDIYIYNRTLSSVEVNQLYNINPTMTPTFTPTATPTLSPSFRNTPDYKPNQITHYDFALLSLYVYGDYPSLLYSSQWKIYGKASNENKCTFQTIGYCAQAYIQKNGNDIVIAHRGTKVDLEHILTNLPTFVCHNLEKDFSLPFVGNAGEPYYQLATKYTRQILNLINYDNEYNLKNYKLVAHTGHSLGGGIAQLMVATYYNSSVYSVVFDSPGIWQVITSNPHLFGNELANNPSLLGSLIVTYNAATNMVNSINYHLGTIIRLYPEYFGAKDYNGLIATSYIISFTDQQHSMLKIYG